MLTLLGLGPGLSVLSGGCGSSSASADLPAAVAVPLSVVVSPVSLAATTASSTLYGTTRAREEAQLAFSVAGPVAWLGAEVGASVTVGEVLARLDEAPLRHRLSALSASAAELSAQRGQVDRDLARLTTLAASESVSPQQLEQLTTQQEALAASGDALSARIAEARWALSQATLRSPVDGTLTARRVGVGEVVGAGVPVLSVRADSGLEVVLAVPEGLVSSLSVGQPVEVAFPLAGLSPRVGEVVSVAQAASGEVGLFPVRAQLPDDPALRPGLTVEVTLRPPATAGSVSVPLAAVVAPSGAGARVHRIRDSQVEVVPVEIVAVEQDRVAVRGALVAGEDVVVRGHAGLLDGVSVEVRR